MRSLYKSILDDEDVLIGSVNSNLVGRLIYDKLIEHEKLTEEELKWINEEVGVFKVNEKQLEKLIKNLKIYDISLNWLDVSCIEDMSFMFYTSKFNGDISKWDVSNVKDMSYMFCGSKFNGDISKWDVSSVTDMSCIFSQSNFNNDISKWDVSNVKNMSYMFNISVFNGDISKWDVSKVKNMNYMFSYSQFNGDISKWDVSKVESMSHMFAASKFNSDISKWDINDSCETLCIFKNCPIKDKYKPAYQHLFFKLDS